MWYQQPDKPLWKWLRWGGLAIWLFAAGLALHWDGTKPMLPDPATGRVLELNNHGHVVYLTLREQLLLWTVMFSGLGSMFAALALALRSGPARSVSMTKLNALHLGFLVFVGLFVVWAIFLR